MGLASLLLLSLPILIHSEIRLGLIESDPNLIRVCDHAIQKALADGVCHDPIVLINASGCVESKGPEAAEGTANAARLFFEENIVGIISSRCSDESWEISRLSYFENIPVINRIGSCRSLLNNQQNPTIVAAPITTVVGFAKAIAMIMQRYRFTSVTLVGPEVPLHRDNFPLHHEVGDQLNAQYNFNTSTSDIGEGRTTDEFLASIDLNSRFIVFIGDTKSAGQFYRKIDLNIVVSSEFLIVFACEDTPMMCVSESKSQIRSSKTLLLTYNYDQGMETYNEIMKAVAVDPILHMEVLATYDSCYTFCYGTSLTAPSNGLQFSQSLRGMTVGPQSRRLVFDETPAILRSYALYKLDETFDNFTKIADFTSQPVASCSPAMVSTCFDMLFESANQHDYSPSDRNLSDCSFKGINCANNYALPVSVSAVAAIIVLLGLGFYCYRRRMRLEIYRLHWKIPQKDFKIIDNPTGGVKSNSKAKYTKRRNIDSYILMGSTKAEYVELVQREKVSFTKEELQLLFDLKKASHDNLAKFLGVHYNETHRFLFMHTFVDRATLDDILKNIENSGKRFGMDYEGIDPTDPFIDHESLPGEDLSVDMMFKSGFVHDIIKGLTYLHRSVGPHGWLSTHTCLIDSNWVLKLTNFGIGQLLNKYTERGLLLTEKNIPYSHYVAIAPEHLKNLRIGTVYPKASKEGDVYSLGIIACQILFDVDPYTDSMLLTQDVLMQIGQDLLTPTLPQTTSQFEEKLKGFIVPCLLRDPRSRWTLRSVADGFNKVFQKSRGNLVDQMLQRNAQYASQLETTVNLRTQELQGAQLTTYKLLCELLPRSVADKLRMGIKVEPRSYDSATVLFCQICQFQHFLTHSTADQVIRFLNNVFTLFDEVIRNEDAYKVETTGETYMVASGVPTENENRHVFIIADIALKIREATHHYSDYKPPDWKLEVRMGFHCGPIATGVIGLKSPRYCLFGDTVNFASRMQSNCAPNQIQLSEVTANMLIDCDKYTLTRRGVVKVKGKGNVNTYWLNEHTEIKE